MSLQFVFGPAGCGKSTYVHKYLIEESLKAPSENFLLIVPDQFTMQTQMDIVKNHPKKGILNIDVLSFGRLSYRVFSAVGKPERPVLDDTGKSLVLRRVSSLIAEKMPMLGRNLNKIGFIHEIKSSISEFMQYGLSVKDVQNMAAKFPDSIMQKKLSDLSVVYEAFNSFNKDRFITNEETLDLLCEKLDVADFVKGSTIVFDGFTGFTPIQERVVMKLCSLAKKVIITFDLSLPETAEETGGEEKLFYLSRKGALRLKSFSKDQGIAVDKDIIIESERNRFSDNPELSHLEKNLFRTAFEKLEKPCENISMYVCRSLDEEVRETCIKIHDLIRSGEYAYKDIAVVTGNLDSYGKLFESRMRELDMPVFIDKTNSIVLNPFIEYVKSALLVVSNDFTGEAVLRYLRSGFTDFSEAEIDRFDKYISSLAIRGKSAYSKPFKRLEKGVRDKELAKEELTVHEAFRGKFYEAFAPLLRKCETAGDYARNLYEFIKANNSYEKLSEYEKWFEEKNDLSKAKEYGQIYRLIMELLDTIVLLIGDEKMDIKEFFKIFEAGIGEIEVGTIPRNIDRIVVGDIERTRLSEVKALFFVGVNDGNVPKTGEKGGILSNVERQTLIEAGYDLAPSGREEKFTQRLYLYMTLCKPTHKLFISYSETDTDGKGMRPSYLIEVLSGLFSGLEPVRVSESSSISKMLTLSDSAQHFAGLLRKYVEGSILDSEKKIASMLFSVYKDKAFELGDKIEKAAFDEYIAAPLSEEIARMIYGSTLRASISRMELYANCAYAHFLKYAMQLKASEEFVFERSDLGTVYHGVLDCFYTELERRNLSWKDFSKEEGDELVEKAVRNYCENYEQGLIGDDEQGTYMIEKVIKIMKRTVDTLKFQLSRSTFKPVSHEFSFERQINLSNDRKMILNGKIDRIDMYEEDDRIYVKILDYKSSDRKVDITNVYHGIEQQLSLYMAEAVHNAKVKNPGKQIIPSALLYYTIDDPLLDKPAKATDEAIEADIRKALRLSGILEESDENIRALDENAMGDASVLPVSFYKNGNVNGGADSMCSREDIEGMLMYVESLAKEIGERIYSGDKRINPVYASTKADACRFCDYKLICRFDEKIPGYKMRSCTEVTKDEAKEKVFGGGKNGLYLFD